MTRGGITRRGHPLPAPVLAIVALATLAVASGGLGASFAGPASAMGGADAARPDPVVAHWTPERLRAAIPRDFVFDPVGGLRPVAYPAGKAGAVTRTTTSASWPDDRGDIYSATGKVYFELDGVAYICSAAVVDDDRTDASLVLTAGHCAYDIEAATFASNWLFIPEFDSSPTFTCADTAHGCWSANALVVHSGYAAAGAFNEQATIHDWALAVVGPGGNDGDFLEDVVDGFALDPTARPAGEEMFAFGYPAAGRYDGNDLTYCAGRTASDPLRHDATYRLGCTMSDGSSGGPWLSSFTRDGDSGLLSSVNSYGYAGSRAMFGPTFDEATAATLAVANDATVTANTIVP